MIFLIAGGLAMALGLVAWPLMRRFPRSQRRAALVGEHVVRLLMIVGGAIMAVIGVFLIAYTA